MSTGPYDTALDRGEQEALFSRDDDSGHLVRMSGATREELDLDVRLRIDGHEVVVKKALPATDEQGRVLKDEDGLVIVRPTTIYDAASYLYRDVLDQAAPPIPLLCHREYMEPVGVCRVCSVQVAKLRKRTGRIEVAPRLVPACHHRVEDQMIIDTIESPDRAAVGRVRGAVGLLVELLMADHPVPCAKQVQSGDCELEGLASGLQIDRSRVPGRSNELPRDNSSLVIAVDHNACILCDRCIRGCNDIKENQVIGRMGKGYGTRIAFDLDSPLGSSSCVACGECMLSCPTGALTHRGIVEANLPAGIDVDEDELFAHPIREIREAFQGVARPFLRWNARAVARRQYRKGDILCREGEFGSTAFLIEKGSVEVFLSTPTQHVDNRPERSLFGWVTRFRSRLASRDEDRREGEGSRGDIPTDSLVSLPYHRPHATMGPGDIVGEMTCMNFYPRSATVRAAEDTTVLEMLRNVLYIMQRTPSFRRVIEQKYRERAINSHLRSVGLFAPLRADPNRFERFVDQVRPRAWLRRCDPGEVILRQGAPATDGFYLVRTGFVKVTQARPGGEHVLTYVGPGQYIGEIGLMARLPELADAGLTGVRTSTCTALDHVDLVRIGAEDFREILEQFPEVRAELVAEVRRRIENDRRAQAETRAVPLGDFLDSGLVVAQSLLVLDLEKCTRCDECTRACADTHEGVTRLVREGLRFDRFLVASSCRSCLDPYCMVGCPVGSIRRRETREIIIEDWCIGCGLCADNCPYGNINMVEIVAGKAALASPEVPGRQAVVRKATTCDLCSSLGPGTEPSCVYACPHDAAHRVTGADLLDLVRARGGTRG